LVKRRVRKAWNRSFGALADRIRSLSSFGDEAPGDAAGDAPQGDTRGLGSTGSFRRLTSRSSSRGPSRKPSGGGSASRQSSGTSVGEWEQPRWRPRWLKQGQAAEEGAPAGSSPDSSVEGRARQQREADRPADPDMPPLVAAGAEDASAQPAAASQPRSQARGLKLKPRLQISAPQSAAADRLQSPFAAASGEGTAAATAEATAAAAAAAPAIQELLSASGGQAPSGDPSCAPPQQQGPRRLRSRSRHWRLSALGRRIRFRQPRRHDEWRRAHARLVVGMNVEDLVRTEFCEIYGREAIAAVLPGYYNRGLQTASDNYTIARTQLEVCWAGRGDLFAARLRGLCT
jgi:hypothetical protein